ncbi:MAG TPA: YeeE/YedE family protein [Magnetospirillum sp.]|nr:YeeE/YedE family protein [Magnetospirillum sp.]
MRAILSAFAAGLLFGAGLLVSGMADPANVLGFFDVAGAWNPTLAFVMAGGLGVTLVGYRVVLKRPAPLCEDRFQVPSSKVIDGKLIGGAALFGLGWGIAGYCPGPAFVAAGAGFVEAAWFTLAMLAGMTGWKLVSWRMSTCPIAARIRAK